MVAFRAEEALALFAAPETIPDMVAGVPGAQDAPTGTAEADGEDDEDALPAVLLTEEGPDAPQPHGLPRGGRVDAEAARAFAVLYEAELASLIDVAYRVLGERPGAEDVAQATALRVLPHWPRVRAQAAQLAGGRERASYYERCYLRRACKNIAIAQWRARGRLAAHVVASLDTLSEGGADAPGAEQDAGMESLLASSAPESGDPAEVVTRRETWGEVLALCTARQRAILAYRLDGYTYEEIAGLLAGVPGIGGNAGQLRKDICALGKVVRERLGRWSED